METAGCKTMLLWRRQLWGCWMLRGWADGDGIIGHAECLQVITRALLQLCKSIFGFTFNQMFMCTFFDVRQRALKGFNILYVWTGSLLVCTTFSSLGTMVCMLICTYGNRVIAVQYFDRLGVWATPQGERQGSWCCNDMPLLTSHMGTDIQCSQWLNEKVVMVLKVLTIDLKVLNGDM